MDNILIAAASQEELKQVYLCLEDSVFSVGLVIALEIVQHYQPWQYLGYVLFHCTVKPQIVRIHIPDPLTLNSLQQLLGTINWIRPSLQITTGKFTNLFNTLKGDPDLNSPRSLSNQARQELDLVNQYLSSRKLTRVNRQLFVRLFCFPTLGMRTGLIGQLSPNLDTIEWLFLSHQPQRTITNYITVLCQLIIKGCASLSSPSSSVTSNA